MEFKIWKSIEVGVYSDVEEIKNAVEKKGSEAGYGIGETIFGGSWPEFNVAMILAGEIKGLAPKMELDLVIVEPREFFGEEWQPSTKIFEMTRCAAHKHGLLDCPPEVGPLLYLLGVDRTVCVGMKPIFASHTFTFWCAFKVAPTKFGVYHDGPVVGMKTKMVFVKPRV